MGRPALRAPAALAAVAVGAAAVLILWWHSTRAIAGPGGFLTTVGEGLGLLGGYAIIIALLLMARLPPVERGIGAGRLARWHANAGRATVGLVSGHVLLIIWGYAAQAHSGVVSETSTLLTSYPDVLMATVAWLLLLGTAGISLRAVRRRVRYETWYHLHLYTYLAAALAVSHQFANGAAFTASLAARLGWGALYLGTALAILRYRLVLPARSFARHRFRVAGVTGEGDRAVSVYIRGRWLGELGAAPGQFFRWRFLAPGLWWQSHPYSLSALPSDDLLRITVRDAGDPTNPLAAVPPGTRVIAEGPYGAFVPANPARPALLIAGGVGITPLRAMLAALTGPVTLIYRATGWPDVVLKDELDALAADRDGAAHPVRVHYIVGPRAALPADPLSPGALRDLVPGLTAVDAYVCGPPGLIDAAVTALAAAGVARRRIHAERFEFAG